MYTRNLSTQKAEPGYDSAFETSLGSSETLWKTNTQILCHLTNCCA